MLEGGIWGGGLSDGAGLSERGMVLRETGMRRGWGILGG